MSHFVKKKEFTVQQMLTHIVIDTFYNMIERVQKDVEILPKTCVIQISDVLILTFDFIISNTNSATIFIDIIFLFIESVYVYKIYTLTPLYTETNL